MFVVPPWTGRHVPGTGAAINSMERWLWVPFSFVKVPLRMSLAGRLRRNRSIPSRPSLGLQDLGAAGRLGAGTPGSPRTDKRSQSRP